MTSDRTAEPAPFANAGLRLSSAAQLRAEPGSEALVVLPERAIRVGGSGAEILSLCDGARSQEAVVAAMRAEHPDAPAELEDEVRAFLQRMEALRVISAEPASGDESGASS